MALQQLAGGPDESARIQTLRATIAESAAATEELEQKLVPRPAPSRFAALQTDIQRFMELHADADRILDLLGRLKVRQRS